MFPKFGGKHPGRPELRLVSRQRSLLDEESKVFRRDSHDRLCFPIQVDCLAYDCWIAAKASRPEFIAQNYDVIFAVLAIFWRESWTDDRANSQHREKIHRDVLHDYLLRLAVAGQIPAKIGDIGHSGKNATLRLPIKEVRRAYCVVGARRL